MTIAEVRGKCKGLAAKIPRDMLVIGVLVLSSTASFALGYLAGQGSGQGTAPAPDSPPVGLSEAVSAASGAFVASRNGTKYYLPSCAGASRISDANKVWFASAEAAVAAGYALAANCKGL